MALRAEQWMMLGVGAIGLYAAYRLTRSSGTRAEDTPNVAPEPPNPLPPPPPPPGRVLPAAPGPVPPMTSAVEGVTGDPMTLRGGAWYKGRIETTSGDGLSPSSSASDVAKAIGARLGLSSVEVFGWPEAAAPVIQHAFSLANPGAGTRWFRARLPVLAPTSVRRPLWLVQIWRSAPPSQPVTGAPLWAFSPVGMKG